jgi:hypothetical protein
MRRQFIRCRLSRGRRRIWYRYWRSASSSCGRFEQTHSRRGRAPGQGEGCPRRCSCPGRSAARPVAECEFCRQRGGQQRKGDVCRRQPRGRPVCGCRWREEGVGRHAGLAEAQDSSEKGWSRRGSGASPLAVSVSMVGGWRPSSQMHMPAAIAAFEAFSNSRTLQASSVHRNVAAYISCSRRPGKLKFQGWISMHLQSQFEITPEICDGRRPSRRLFLLHHSLETRGLRVCAASRPRQQHASASARHASARPPTPASRWSEQASIAEGAAGGVQVEGLASRLGDIGDIEGSGQVKGLPGDTSSREHRSNGLRTAETCDMTRQG